MFVVLCCHRVGKCILRLSSFQVAGRSLGELVRKLGERVLPLIIPILAKGLKDSSSSRRQVSFV